MKKKIIRIIKLNLFKTIIINLKLFPLKLAIKFPIYLYGKIDIRNTSGKGIIGVPSSSGMMKVGLNDSSLFGFGSPSKTRFCIKGRLCINGNNIRFANGTIVVVKEKACLKLEGNNLINTESMIMCSHEIVFCRNARISWQGQVLDTNFHYSIDQERKVSKRNRAVLLGKNVWIGNRVTINPGTIVPDYSIVASNTLLNKDYSSEGPMVLLGGIPGRKLKSGITRVFDKNDEELADSLFEQNPELEIVQLPSNS